MCDVNVVVGCILVDMCKKCPISIMTVIFAVCQLYFLSNMANVYNSDLCTGMIGNIKE